MVAWLGLLFLLDVFCMHRRRRRRVGHVVEACVEGAHAVQAEALLQSCQSAESLNDIVCVTRLSRALAGLWFGPRTCCTIYRLTYTQGDLK